MLLLMYRQQLLEIGLRNVSKAERYETKSFAVNLSTDFDET